MNSSCGWTSTIPKGGYVILIALITSFLIALYGTYRCRTPEFEDPFTRSIIDKYPWNRFVDGWGLLHFWFYAMLSFYFPSCWKEITFIGIIWEVIESLFKDRPFYLAKCDASIEGKEGWWYGRWEDIVMNTMGIGFGLWLKQKGGSKNILSGMLVGILVLQVSLQYAKEQETQNKK